MPGPSAVTEEINYQDGGKEPKRIWLIEHLRMRIRQTVPHCNISRKPVSKFAQDQEKHCESGNKLDDKLSKVVKDIGQQTSQYAVDQ